MLGNKTTSSLNRWSHFEHLKGMLSLWTTFSWDLRVYLVLNFLSHTWQGRWTLALLKTDHIFYVNRHLARQAVAMIGLLLMLSQLSCAGKLIRAHGTSGKGSSRKRHCWNTIWGGQKWDEQSVTKCVKCWKRVNFLPKPCFRSAVNLFSQVLFWKHCFLHLSQNAFKRERHSLNWKSLGILGSAKRTHGQVWELV